MKVILLPICLIACVAICFGQSNKPKPDMTGTWVDVTTKSKKGSPEHIKITYHDPELIIRRTIRVDGTTEERDTTYYTDGRGEKNPPLMWLISIPGSDSSQPPDVVSETTWNKDKIVIHFANRVYAGRAVVEADIKMEFRLSKDGRTLTRNTSIAPLQISAHPLVAVGNGADVKTVYKPVLQ